MAWWHLTCNYWFEHMDFMLAAVQKYWPYIQWKYLTDGVCQGTFFFRPWICQYKIVLCHLKIFRSFHSFVSLQPGRSGDIETATYYLHCQDAERWRRVTTADGAGAILHLSTKIGSISHRQRTTNLSVSLFRPTSLSYVSQFELPSSPSVDYKQ